MGWKEVKLKEVIYHRKGFSVIDDDQEYMLCRVQLHRRGVVLRENKKGALIRTKKQQFCKSGDFLVAEMDAKVGGYGFIPEELDGAIVSSHYFLFEVNENKLLRDYLEVVSQLGILQEQIKAKGSTNYAAIRPKDVLDWTIPLPNILEQHEIINTYSYTKKYIEKLNTELTHQQTLLKQLRQAILQEAVQGKLTEAWRQVHSDVEPASMLLEKIKAEKAKLLQDKKIKKQKLSPPISPDEIPFNLPNGWVWCRLTDLGFITGGGTPSKSNRNYWNGEILWVSPKDMANNTISDSELKITQQGVNNSSAKLIPEGSLIIVGRSGILKRKLPVAINHVACTVNQDMKVLIPYLRMMNRYLQLMLFGFERFVLEHLVKFGMTVHSLKYQEFERQVFPIPPLDEQQAIVEKVEKLLEKVSQLEEEVQRNQQRAEQLLQSVLREVMQPNAAQPGAVEPKENIIV